MWRIRVVLWSCQASLVLMLPSHQGWIPKMPCDRSTRILNDCNLCRCIDSVFQCATRNCGLVDKFAHFNDAIQDIKVGMEGHGVWRSGPSVTESSCDPGVHYTRDDLICVCTKSGHWPHRKCQVIFDKLLVVQNNDLESFDDPCTPGFTYLVKCHVCQCNSAGHVYEPLCTKMDCSKLTPAVLELKEANSVRTGIRDDQKEIYAECTEDVIYKLGCKTCVCQANNRLICDVCEENVNRAQSDKESICSSVTPGVVFKVDCNLCFCDKAGNTVCTMRLCVGKDNHKILRESLPQIDGDEPRLVEAPANDRDCVPGTAYKKDCNVCQCLMGDVKMLVCTKIYCLGSARSPPDTTTELIGYIKNDCVLGTVYEADCRTCHCIVGNGLKMEKCDVNSVCDQDSVKTRNPGNLETLHGYCEPLHIYRKDCNRCECLADGKILKCTTKICPEKPKLESIYVEILPIASQNGLKCPRVPDSYKIDCNYCYCLPNGNALCTSATCDKTSF